MAIACFRLVTFLPLRPDLSLPRFISCISRLTSLPADGEYLRLGAFFEADFLCALLFFVLLFFVLVELRAVDFFGLDFLLLFFVAICILPSSQMAWTKHAVAWRQRFGAAHAKFFYAVASC